MSTDPRLAVGIVPSAGLLVLRLGTGLTMAAAHGWGKLMRLFEDSPRFADPIGIGVVPSLALATFGELVCGVLIAIGLGTRLATIPFATTMIVALLVAHAGDPWSEREHAFLFLVPALTIALTGPGRYSIDEVIARRRRRRRSRRVADPVAGLEDRPVGL
jgi:putative oxidoreductase